MSDGGGDYDVWCEIWVNSMLCARTTIKRSTANPEWHESFLIGDLPPFDNLQITLCKERRGSARSRTHRFGRHPSGDFSEGRVHGRLEPYCGCEHQHLDRLGVL
jgi:hypothetical protein